MDEATSIDPGVPSALQVWVAAGSGAIATLAMTDEGARISIAGALDAAALQPCRAALQAAVAAGVLEVIIDLAMATPDRHSAALLGAIRRFGPARGLQVTVTGIGPALWTAIHPAEHRPHGGRLPGRRAVGGRSTSVAR